VGVAAAEATNSASSHFSAGRFEPPKPLENQKMSKGVFATLIALAVPGSLVVGSHQFALGGGPAVPTMLKKYLCASNKWAVLTSGIVERTPGRTGGRCGERELAKPDDLTGR
jgi:hypothetical protein